VFNVRGDLVLPLEQRRKIVCRRITRDRNFGAGGYESRYDSKMPSNRDVSISNPAPRTDESYMTILC